MEALQDAVSGLTLKGGNLLFRPPRDLSWMNAKLKQIPRFLFRLSTPDSDGTTDECWVKSMSFIHRSPFAKQDYLARDDLAQVADEIYKHLKWQPKHHDNFVSWTNSLLFVLQYGLFRANRSRDSRSRLDNIYLCVIDTSLFEEGTFIQDMDLIEAYKPYCSPLSNLESLRKKQHINYTGTYYFGEYLSQGALNVKGKIGMITLKSVLDCNLLALQPELDMSTKKWADEVVRLRESFYERDEDSPNECKILLLSEQEAQAALAITDLFEPRWRLALAANFLGLQPRSQGDKVIMLCLRRLKLTAYEKLDCNPLGSLIGPAIPEVEHARRIYNEFCFSQWFTPLNDSLRDAECAFRNILIRLLGREVDLERAALDLANHEAESLRRLGEVNLLKEQVAELLAPHLS